MNVSTSKEKQSEEVTARPAQHDNGERGLSVEDFAKRLNLSRGSVYGLLASGQVKSLKIGKRRLIPSTEVGRILRGAC